MVEKVWYESFQSWQNSLIKFVGVGRKKPKPKHFYFKLFFESKTLSFDFSFESLKNFAGNCKIPREISWCFLNSICTIHLCALHKNCTLEQYSQADSKLYSESWRLSFAHVNTNLLGKAVTKRHLGKNSLDLMSDHYYRFKQAQQNELLKESKLFTIFHKVDLTENEMFQPL